MKSFLLKYKRTIIFWIVFLAIHLFFAPQQKDYYLDNDIETFKQTYFTKILIWTGIVASVAVFFLVLIKAKSLKQSAIAFASAGLTLAFFLFIFQNVFLGFSLFINRQFRGETVEKAYVVNYLLGTDKKKDNFFPFDLAANEPTFDKKLVDKIYRQELRLLDTVKVTFNKGLFGIAFQPHSFSDK